MLTIFQAVIFGAVQGVTELFPISSLGHSVILPRLLGWNIRQEDPFFLTFLVATHAATAFVLFLFFFKEWMKIIQGFFRSFAKRKIDQDDTYAKLAWLLVVGTMPAGLLGLLFQDSLRALFASPRFVASILALNGVLLYGAEILRRSKKEEMEKGSDSRISKIKWVQAVKVGVTQCLALIPGFSRTGSTMTGGLMIGLAHEDAARFSFLLATPIIGAAAFLKLPELVSQNERAVLMPSVVGAISAGVFAYLSVKFLTKYFQSKTLTPFAIYCFLLGVLASLLFLFQ